MKLTLSAHDLGHMLGAGYGHTLGHVHTLLPGLVVARGVLVQVEQGEVQRELQSSLVVQGVDPLTAAAAAIPLQLGEQGARHLGKEEGGLLLFSRRLSWVSNTGQRRERRVGIEEGEKRRLWKEKPLVQKRKSVLSPSLVLAVKRERSSANPSSRFYPPEHVFRRYWGLLRCRQWY